MFRVFFISDAHLGDGQDNRRRENRLLAFLESIEKGSELFLLGDLFDVWFEYNTVIPKNYFNTLYALKKLALKGVRISFITGNHDFWVQDFFTSTLNITLYTGWADVKLRDFRCFIAHGDGLTGREATYRLVKKILRNPLNVGLYRLIHPDIGIPLASWFSRWSRKNPSRRHNDEAYMDFARRKFSDGFDYVILGHTHRPQEFREGSHTYLNIGDWMNTFTYGKLENGRLTLEKWE